MKQLGIALLATSSLLAAGAASASMPEWTYGQIGYYQADSTGDDQTDAITVAASIGILDMWHFGVNYMDGSLGGYDFVNQQNVDNDFDGYEIRAGAHPAINDSSQLVIDAVYFDTSYDKSGSGGNIDRDGYGFGVGVRSMITDKVEATGMGYWTDASFEEDQFSSDSDATKISVVLGGRYHWTENFSTGATVTIGDAVVASTGDNSMNLDVRWTFGGFNLGQ